MSIIEIQSIESVNGPKSSLCQCNVASHSDSLFVVFYIFFIFSGLHSRQCQTIPSPETMSFSSAWSSPLSSSRCVGMRGRGRGGWGCTCVRLFVNETERSTLSLS